MLVLLSALVGDFGAVFEAVFGVAFEVAFEVAFDLVLEAWEAGFFECWARAAFKFPAMRILSALSLMKPPASAWL